MTAGTAIELRRVTCPRCGGGDAKVKVTLPDYWYGVSGSFTVERCQACGHEFMNPQPVSHSIAACYPDRYQPHAKETVSRDDAETGSVARPWFLRLLPLRYVPGLKRFVLWLSDDLSQPVPQAGSAAAAQPRALEIGCASGRYLNALRAAGWDAEGVELCEAPAAAARHRGFTVHCGTLESAAFAADQFDLAVAWMVIEHVPDPITTLREIHRVLCPGARLLVSVPNARCWQRFVFGRCWYGWDLPRHLQHVSPSSIRQILEQCGFDEVRVVHQRTLLSLMGSIGIWLGTWMPGSRLSRWFLAYPDQPRQLIQLLLAPLAILLSWAGQSERLTVSAVAANHAGAESATVDAAAKERR